MQIRWKSKLSWPWVPMANLSMFSWKMPKNFHVISRPSLLNLPVNSMQSLRMQRFQSRLVTKSNHCKSHTWKSLMTLMSQIHLIKPLSSTLSLLKTWLLPSLISFSQKLTTPMLTRHFLKDHPRSCSNVATSVRPPCQNFSSNKPTLKLKKLQDIWRLRKYLNFIKRHSKCTWFRNFLAVSRILSGISKCSCLTPQTSFRSCINQARSIRW